MESKCLDAAARETVAGKRSKQKKKGKTSPMSRAAARETAAVTIQSILLSGEMAVGDVVLSLCPVPVLFVF